MNQCLACLLSAVIECPGCSKPLCEGCIYTAEVEDNDYSGDEAGGYITYDVECCQECVSNGKI